MNFHSNSCPEWHQLKKKKSVIRTIHEWCQRATALSLSKLREYPELSSVTQALEICKCYLFTWLVITTLMLLQTSVHVEAFEQIGTYRTELVRDAARSWDFGLLHAFQQHYFSMVLSTTLESTTSLQLILQKKIKSQKNCKFSLYVWSSAFIWLRSTLSQRLLLVGSCDP